MHQRPFESKSMRMRKAIRVAPLLLLAACTTTAVLNSAQVQSAIPNKGVYGVKAFGDSDPTTIKGRQPGKYAVHGIDISRYNKAIDWPRARANGIKFAFIKATEGKDDSDRNFHKFWAEAARAGVRRSAYHFYYFCATPEAQARNYMRVVRREDRSLPPILDVEWNSKSPTCRKRPPKVQVVDVLQRWLTMIEKHYNQKPIIYTTVDFYADNLSDGALPGYQYWLRSVTAQPKYKYGNRPWRFWQYTGTGRVPGISGDVDINVFNGTESQWRSWTATNSR